MEHHRAAGIVSILVGILGYGLTITVFGSFAASNDPVMMGKGLFGGALSSIIFCMGLFKSEIIAREKKEKE